MIRVLDLQVLRLRFTKARITRMRLLLAVIVFQKCYRIDLIGSRMVHFTFVVAFRQIQVKNCVFHRIKYNTIRTQLFAAILEIISGARHAIHALQQLCFEGFIRLTEKSLFVVVESPKRQIISCGAVGAYLQVVILILAVRSPVCVRVFFSCICMQRCSYLREIEILRGGHDCFLHDWDLC